MSVWTPTRSHEECTAIMTAPGMPWELEDRVIKGRPGKVFKNTPASLRDFWESTRAIDGNKTYLVLADQRVTYAEAHTRAIETAAMLASLGVTKGDKVALAARNLPDYVCVFFACHLLGAVACLTNAWLPAEPLSYCITNCGAKVCFVDEERAVVLAGDVAQLKKAGCEHFIVLSGGDVSAPVLPRGMEAMEKRLRPFKGTKPAAVRVEILPEDPATIFFTSGTTGMPKGVLSTHRQFCSNLLNTTVGGARAILRRGEDLPAPVPNAPQKALLLAVPLFHVTGNQSLLMLISSLGGKIVLMHKWHPATAIKLIHEEGITLCGGIPAFVMDIIDSGIGFGKHTLEAATFGGAQAPETLPEKMKQMGLGAMSAACAYGLTESNSILTSHAGEDYLMHPTSCGRASLINELKIVELGKDKALPVGSIGEICARGPNIAEGYFNNPKATAESFSADGWFKTGDIGYLNEGGWLFILDRAKEIIIRGGENIATVTVENALYRDDRVKDCAVVPVPHARLGEVVSCVRSALQASANAGSAVVVVKASAYADPPTAASLKALCATVLPSMAVPVLIVVQQEELPRNVTGKVLKRELKERMATVWARLGALEAKL